MQKRIDSIYICNHRPYLDYDRLRVSCEKCPYEIRPSMLDVGQIITFKGTIPRVYVDADRDRFVVGRYDG